MMNSSMRGPLDHGGRGEASITSVWHGGGRNNREEPGGGCTSKPISWPISYISSGRGETAGTRSCLAHPSLVSVSAGGERNVLISACWVCCSPPCLPCQGCILAGQRVLASISPGSLPCHQEQHLAAQAVPAVWDHSLSSFPHPQSSQCVLHEGTFCQHCATPAVFSMNFAQPLFCATRRKSAAGSRCTPLSQPHVRLCSVCSHRVVPGEAKQHQHSPPSTRLPQPLAASRAVSPCSK